MTADDENRDFVRRLFATEAPPADVVPPTPLTPEERREHLLAMNANAGWAEVTIPGQVIVDPDGVPTGVEPSRTETVHRGAAVTRSELERAGLTAQDVPNLTIIDDIPRSNPS